MTICCVPNGSITEMWQCVCLVLLVQGNWITSLPIQEALSTSSPTNAINATETTRPVRQLDFTECCPCPKNKDGSNDEVLEAVPSNAVEAAVLPKGFGRDLLRGDDGGVAGCSCELRNADAAAAASDLTREVSALRSALTSPSVAASEDSSILKPEIGFAESFLETLREATDEEYRDAVERDAQRSQARSPDAVNEGNNNIVNIIVAPHDDQEDVTLENPSSVQNSRRVLSPLDSISRKNKPATRFIKDILELPSSRSLKDKKIDNVSKPREVDEQFSKSQGDNNDNSHIIQNPSVKQSKKLANLDSASSSSNIETSAPNSNQPRSKIDEQSKLLPLGRSSISEDFLKLKNVKDIVGEREVKLKVPYLKVPSLINKDSNSRSSGRKLPSLSELLEDIISPTTDDVRPNEESENQPQQSKDETKNVDETNDIDENYDDNDNKKFKTRILDTLPSRSQIDENNNIPSNFFIPNFPVQSLDSERDNVEDDIPSQEADEYPNDPEGSQSIQNVMIVPPISPEFTPEERSSNEINSLEAIINNSFDEHTNSDSSDPNQVGTSKSNSTNSGSNQGSILERLDKLSKISNDLEKIKDIVEDMSKSKLESNKPIKSADSDMGASEIHENISILPNKVLQAPQSLSNNLKILGNKLRSNKKGMLGASSDRIQSLTLPRLSDLTAKPFDVFNLMLPQDRIIQPSLIDPSKILPWDINNLRARAVPELPSVDEIRDRISDFIGRSGLGINALSDMDDESNVNHPIFALGKPRENQQTELVDLDVFRLRPLKVYSPTKSRSQQPVQGFNLEKFKAKVQVPTKSVKAVKLQSSFGKDGRIVGGRFSLQPPSEAFWDKVRNTKPPTNSNILKNQPISPLDSLKSNLKARTDNILQSVKSNGPVLSSPLVGNSPSQIPLKPLQATSSSFINEVRKRVDDVLGATNAGQRDFSLKDSLLDRKATIENRLQEIHSDLVQQKSAIEPLTTKYIRNKDSRTSKTTVESQINKPKMSTLSKFKPESDKTRIDTKLSPTKKRIARPKSNIELSNPNVNSAKSTQSIAGKARPNVKRLRGPELSPSDTVTIKSMPDLHSLKKLNFKDDMSLRRKSALRPNSKIGFYDNNLEKKGTEIKFDSSAPLLRSVLKRKNLEGLKSPDSSTIPTIPRIRKLLSPEKLSYESVILKDSYPKDHADPDEKLSNAVIEKFNEKIQSRLNDIDARAKKILQSSNYVQFKEPQLGASENQKRLSLLRPLSIKQSEELYRKHDNDFKESSTESFNGPSWQKLTEKIQSRLSEADAAVKKSLEHSNSKQRSQLHGNTPNDRSEDLNSPRSSSASTSGPSWQKLTERIQSRLSEADVAVKKSLGNSNPTQKSKLHGNIPTDMSEGASQTEIKRLNTPEKPLKNLSKSPTAFNDLSDNLKSKLSDANEALKQALQNARSAKDSEITPPPEHSKARTKSDDSHDGPLAKLTEKLSKRFQKTELNHESDLEQRATETHDLAGNHDAPLDKLRDKLQSRFAETDKALKYALKGPGIVQPEQKDRSIEAIEDYGTENFTPLKNTRPLLDKITERMQNRNKGSRHMFVSSEIAEPMSSRDGLGDSQSTNIMKVSPAPLLKRLAENHRLPSLSHATQPLLGAAPKNIGDLNEGASENIDFTNPVNSQGNEYVPLKTTPLAKLTKKLQNKIFREDNPVLKNVEDEGMVPNSSDNLQVASRNSNKPMKQNVTYRCRMVCEEVSEKK